MERSHRLETGRHGDLETRRPGDKKQEKNSKNQEARNKEIREQEEMALPLKHRDLRLEQF